MIKFTGSEIKKATPGSAGYDLSSTEELTIAPLSRALVDVGLKLEIPANMYGRIAPRSGLAYRNGIDVLAGVIDSDYRGQIKVILINLGDKEFKINKGDKIAQIIFYNLANVHLTPAISSLSETSRGDGGFGSTGV